MYVRTYLFTRCSSTTFFAVFLQRSLHRSYAGFFHHCTCVKLPTQLFKKHGDLYNGTDMDAKFQLHDALKIRVLFCDFIYVVYNSIFRVFFKLHFSNVTSEVFNFEENTILHDSNYSALHSIYCTVVLSYTANATLDRSRDLWSRRTRDCYSKRPSSKVATHSDEENRACLAMYCDHLQGLFIPRQSLSVKVSLSYCSTR